MKRVLAILVFLAACCGGEPIETADSRVMSDALQDFDTEAETEFMPCAQRCAIPSTPLGQSLCLQACEPCESESEPTPDSCASWCDHACSDRMVSEGLDGDWLAACFDQCQIGTAFAPCTEDPRLLTGCGSADR